MSVSPSTAWKVGLACALLGTVAFSARARAPRRALPGSELQRLVAAALLLYAVGTVAWLTRHLSLAVLVFAAGIATAALGAWLSRGDDPQEPPRDAEPPSLEPDGPQFDWDAFERDLRDYAAGPRTPAGSSR